MPKVTFKNNDTHLPVTMKQFEELTNEILKEINKLNSPNFLEGDYMAQVLMSAIHALDHKQGYVKKSDLFASCLNRVSCHVTYHAVQEIQARINVSTLQKAKAEKEGTTLEVVDSQGTTPVEQETSATH
jgi:hypothetical protein